MVLEKIKKILYSELKHHSLHYIVPCFSIYLLIYMIFGFEKLNKDIILIISERLLPLMGIVLISLFFQPEIDNGILQVVKSKKTSIELTYWIRLIVRIFIYVLMTLIIFLIIKGNNGELLFQQYFLESISIGLLLGSVGFFVSAISNNIIYACFSSLGVYLLSWLPNGTILGIFYLFRIGKGLYPMIEIKCIISLVLLVIGLYIRRIQKVW